MIVCFLGVLIAIFVSFARYFLLARVGQKAMLDLWRSFSRTSWAAARTFHPNPVGRLRPGSPATCRT
jgi:hypothetical protein